MARVRGRVVGGAEVRGVGKVMVGVMERERDEARE